MKTNSRIRFGVVGSGWRSACYLKTAALMGQKCSVTGVVSRSEEKRAAITAEWGVDTFRTAAELADKNGADFLFVSVPGNAVMGVLHELIPLGIPLLVETPPASTVEELVALNEAARSEGARIQIAEQYALQPMNSARLALLASLEIGKPTYAHVSVNHSYHNIGLIRKYLGIGFENAEIRASSFSAPLVNGPGRGGDPTAEEIGNPEQQLALFDFAGRRALFDYESNQHRSWVRTQRILIRGERGEIADTQVRYLKDFLSPVHEELERVQTGGEGNMEGYFLKSINFADRVLYLNETAPARLSDEEIAQARCLLGMKEYVETGKDFYSLAEASQDTYLAIMMRAAIATGNPILTATQNWAR